MPLFQLLTHNDVVCSLLLENRIDTIHNVLLGPSGRRTLQMFGWILPVLPNLIFDSDADARFEHLAACTAVLQRTIDLNGTALVLEPLHSVIREFSDVCTEDTLRDAGPASQRALYSISRIQRRLGVGAAISKFDLESPPMMAAPRVLLAPSDLPGRLSSEGPRHDNDHEVIADIRIMPTAREIQSRRSEYLPYQDPAT